MNNKLSLDEVKEVIHAYAKQSGFEILNRNHEDVTDTAPDEYDSLSDGRPVFIQYGRKWSPSVSLWQQMQRDAENTIQADVVDAEKDSEIKIVAGSENLVESPCPRCGDELQHSTVCPACSIGKSGYTHRYSCVCGFDFVSREKI